MNQIKAVLFDMDGTLIDTFGEMTREAQKKKPSMIERYINRRVEQLPSYSYCAMMEMIAHDPLLRYFQSTVKASFDRRMRERYRNAPLKLGAKSFLQDLHAQGVCLCLCTNNARHIVDQILKDHALEGLFQEVITCQDVSAPKPDPEMYQKAMERIHAAPNECLVFEDMLEGIMAGRAAGIDVIAVYDEFNKADLEAIYALSKLVIHDYTDKQLLEYI